MLFFKKRGTVDMMGIMIKLAVLLLLFFAVAYVLWNIYVKITGRPEDVTRLSALVFLPGAMAARLVKRLC